MSDQVPLKKRRWTEYQINELDAADEILECDHADTLKDARKTAARLAKFASPGVVKIEIEKVRHTAMENDEYQIQEDHDMEYQTIETIAFSKGVSK